MSDNVIPFNAVPADKEKNILVCSSCGCTSFHVCSDGNLYCASCEESLGDDITAVPWDNVFILGDEDSKNVIRCTSFETEDLAYRRLLRRIKEPTDVVMLSAVFRDGTHRVWSIGCETPEQEEWLQSRIDETEALVGLVK